MFFRFLCIIFASQKQQGGLAQLARALAWHARGHEFESRILHQETTQKIANPCKSRIYRDFYFGRNAECDITPAPPLLDSDIKNPIGLLHHEPHAAVYTLKVQNSQHPTTRERKKYRRIKPLRPKEKFETKKIV